MAQCRAAADLQARLEEEAQCILIIIGATPEGTKELIGFTDGTRESAHDWRVLLLDLKRRGLTIAPELAVADGALGFWKALGEVWPKTREQRCWVHKTANVLAKLPKSQHPKARRAQQDIWMAETKVDAETAFDAFIEGYRVKYDKAAECLCKDRGALLAFYDLPAEHWKHLRTTNPVVFHSLSKRSSVPGLRSGFVAGDAPVLADFRLYRTYHGCAVPVHTQLASIPAWQDEEHVRENRRLYREKFSRVVPILSEVMDVDTPAGAFYLWPRVGDDEAFTRGLFAQQHVTVLPGSYLARDSAGGNPGRGRVRISLVASVGESIAFSC